MKKLFLITAYLSIIALFISCGGKPGGLKDLTEIAPEFALRLNESLQTDDYAKLMKLFDKNCKIIVSTEFNPLFYDGTESARRYFASLPRETVFETTGGGELEGLRTEIAYKYKLKTGAWGDGTWKFKLNNMGKISELTITPGESHEAGE